MYVIKGFDVRISIVPVYVCVCTRMCVSRRACVIVTVHCIALRGTAGMLQVRCWEWFGTESEHMPSLILLGAVGLYPTKSERLTPVMGPNHHNKSPTAKGRRCDIGSELQYITL
eukprot:scpid72555/ scgid13103/ 